MFGNKKGKPTAESWNLGMHTIDISLSTEVCWANLRNVQNLLAVMGWL